MTEAEWLACELPEQILAALPEPLPARKVRLTFCACLRSREMWSLLISKRSRRAVEASEQYADGQLSAAELRKARTSANNAWAELSPSGRYYAALLATSACWLDRTLSQQGITFLQGLAADRRISVSAVLLRDIFGNPFRPVTLNRSWLTSTVALLAQGIYAERAFDRMPILADALQDAGCDNDDMLYHCRGFDQCLRCGGTGRSIYDWGYAPPPTETCPECTGTGWSAMKTSHVRGCWVVDLVLGKT